MKQDSRGFTLVELMVAVIILIILSMIVTASLISANVRAQDTQRMQDVETIAVALRLYRADYGHALGTGSGCGGNGNGNGWFNHVNGSNYPKSMAKCLVDAGYLPKEIIDPTGATSASASTKGHAYMKYSCVQEGRTVTYVYASLAGKPRFADAPTATDGTCAAGADTSYGMNHWTKI